MRYLALACDYDGTLARDGRVDDATVAALLRLRDTGRRLVLVTGRQLDDLQRVCPQLDLFDRVVAENGALLFRPGGREEQALTAAPPEAFVQALRARQVTPLAAGRVIVSTWEPNETAVLAAIRDLGLELQVAFNKGAVMVLPSGVNKATGLQVALRELGLSPHNAVAVGDAENDHAFLALCECAVAVANALPMLKEQCDWVTRGDHGLGVVELIDALAASDLATLEPRLERHHILIGVRDGEQPVRLPPAGATVLLAGRSGSGKSTLATGFLERLAARGYQFCVVDPEGDYADLGDAVVLGDRHRAPSADEVLDVLARPEQPVVVNLLGVALEDRPAFFEGLLPRLQELRARTGRPHWIVVDEAHHLVPATWDSARTLPQALDGMLLITVHPDHLSPAVLASIDTVITVGAEAERTLAAVPQAATAADDTPSAALEAGEALAWSTHLGRAPFRMRIVAPETERRRHQRKYAEGELGEDKSFYFRGRDARLNLRAQNLTLFAQLADGVDDDTWLFHLRAGDYSRWLRSEIKDDALADAVAALERRADLDARASRAAVRAAIEQRYTLPS